MAQFALTKTRQYRYTNTQDVLKLREIGVQFEHGKKQSSVTFLPKIQCETIDDLLTLCVEYGRIVVTVDENGPVMQFLDT